MSLVVGTGGGRDGVQPRVRGPVQGRAQGTERGWPPGQSHRAVCVRGRRGAGGAGLPVGAERPVRAASGRPAGRQLATGHGVADGPGSHGGRDRADGQLSQVPRHPAPERGGTRRYGIRGDI